LSCPVVLLLCAFFPLSFLGLDCYADDLKEVGEGEGIQKVGQPLAINE
jgi:hypothetical protein